ncbi:MAG: DUF1282 family protein [Rhodocyclales bacterium]|nr:DUF1282 family protein [Rhodocyclales bacterium]
MGFMLIPRMVLAPREVWPELEEQRAGLFSVLFYTVLPISLLPPFMFYNAGIHHGDAMVAGWSLKPWGDIAAILTAGELITIAVMGWLIKIVAGGVGSRISCHDAYLVAAVAPVPLWLSSLSLLIPDLALNVLVILAGLGASCALMYHGVYALGDSDEAIEVASVTHVVMALLMIAWALLLVPLLLG